MNAVEFTHDIGDLVAIADVREITGRVTGQCRRVWGKTYCVVWWQDGRRHEEWLHEWEVVEAKKK